MNTETLLKKLTIVIAAIGLTLFSIGCADDNHLEDAADSLGDAAENVADSIEDATN